MSACVGWVMAARPPLPAAGASGKPARAPWAWPWRSAPWWAAPESCRRRWPPTACTRGGSLLRRQGGGERERGQGWLGRQQAGGEIRGERRRHTVLLQSASALAASSGCEGQDPAPWPQVDTQWASSTTSRASRPRRCSWLRQGWARRGRGGAGALSTLGGDMASAQQCSSSSSSLC